MRAVVATFRMEKRSDGNRDTHITGRLSYKTNSNVGYIDNTFHRVNYGLWVGEEFNAVQMTLTATAELILVVTDGEGRCVAVQDNRHGVNKRGDAGIYKFDSQTESFFVEVTLVNDEYGTLGSYTYKVQTRPLRVWEAHRVGRIVLLGMGSEKWKPS